MNREIKFRGKRKLNGEWIYGYFVIDPFGNYRIYLKPFDECTSNSHYFVIPETVGQYTGLKDKNGKEIYEGDIVDIKNNSLVDTKSIIEFRDGCFFANTRKFLPMFSGGFFLNKLHSDEPHFYVPEHYNNYSFEVIGNIYENELQG